MPIRSDALVKALVAALSSDEILTQQTAGPEGPRIHAHYAPAPPSAAAWCRLTVREMNTGGVDEHPAGLHIPVQVAAEAKGYPDTPLLLAAVHERVHAVLDGMEVSTDFGTGRHLGRRRRPTPPLHDEKTGALLSSALYTLVAS